MDDAEIISLSDDEPGGGLAEEELRAHALLTGRPTWTAVLPNGRVLEVWPKAQGYFYKIEEAVNAYLLALVHYDRATCVRRWNCWPLPWLRMLRRRTRIDALEMAKFRLMRLIFEDRFNPERHCDLAVDEFLAMPHDVVLDILEAYKRANNIEDILRRLIPGYDKKKEAGVAVPIRSFTRQ